MVLFIPWLSWPLVILFIFIIYLVYMSWHFRLFSSQGVPVPITPIPVLGTLWPAFMTNGYEKYYKNMYEDYGKTIGTFIGRKPFLSTIDVDIIKEVYIRQHLTFPHRSNDKTGDPNTDSMLTHVHDYDHWKYLRSVMSPTFSSGKLRGMMNQINKCAAQLSTHLVENSKEGKAVEMKEFAGAYTMDVIASAAFGLDINTKNDHRSPFVKHAKKATESSVLLNSVIMLSIFYPFLMPLVQLFKPSIISRDVLNFFKDITNQTLDARNKDEGRVDFLQLMMNAHKEEDSAKGMSKGEDNTDKPKRGMTRDEILAQGVLFFLAGYDSTASAISFLAYNLACNPEKQDKLIEEINAVVGDKDLIKDDELFNMPYLDMCVNESLRLYPPAVTTDRTAVKDVDVKGIKLPKGITVSVNIMALHHSPGVYPDPEKFLPERFSSEEKEKRDPLNFMPFGAGPRQCIATRLALLEVKIAIVHILKTHRFVKAPETEVPLKLDYMVLLKAVNGIWVRLERHGSGKV